MQQEKLEVWEEPDLLLLAGSGDGGGFHMESMRRNVGHLQGQTLAPTDRQQGNKDQHPTTVNTEFDCQCDYVWKQMLPQRLQLGTWPSHHPGILFFFFLLLFIYIFSFIYIQFSSVQSLVMSDSLRPHESQHTRTPCPSTTPGVDSNSCPLSWRCHSAISSCCPLLLLPPIPPSIRVFSNESTLRIRRPKYWSFSFSISPSNEHPGLVQGTLKRLLQHHSSKASILQHSAFFTVQLSHPYMTNGKTIALTRQTFVGKVMSLLFNMLSRLVITFLPRVSIF